MHGKIIVSFCVLFSAIASSTWAADQPAPTTMPSNAAQMADEAKLMAPGPEHELLKQFAGTWDADIKLFNPDGSPMDSSKGVMHCEMILGDRFLQMNYEGAMQGPAGMTPFKGVGLSGFDTVKKKYTNLWIDEMSTGMMLTEGTCDGKVLTSDGQMSDPTTGGAMKVREVVTMVDKDHHKYELWMGPEGKMFKMVEAMYTRRK